MNKKLIRALEDEVQNFKASKGKEKRKKKKKHDNLMDEIFNIFFHYWRHLSSSVGKWVNL